MVSSRSLKGLQQIGGLLWQERKIQFEIERSESRFGERGIGLGERRPNVCSPTDLSQNQSPSRKLRIDAAGRRCGDAAPIRKFALRRQALSRSQAPGGNVGRDGVGYFTEVAHWIDPSAMFVLHR